MVNLNKISRAVKTPIYILDKEKIKKNIARIKKNITYQNSQIHYAMFCNDNRELLKFIKNQGLSILVLNKKELKKAFEIGFSKEQITLTGGTFTEEQLKDLIKERITINLDSLKQLELWGKINPHSSVGIRIRIFDKNTRGGEGVLIEEVDNILNIALKYDLNIIGLHTYIGTNTLDENRYVYATKILISLLEKFKKIKYINLGGGFGIPYSTQDKRFSWEIFGKEISNLFLELKRKIQFKIEPGRAIVGDAGYFLTRVIEVRGKDTLIVDAPYTNFARPFVYHINQRVVCLSKKGILKQFKIRGCSINSKDYLSHPEFGGDKALLPKEISKSDIICFKDAGAYSPVMQMDFLNYNKAKIILIENTK